MDRKSIRTAQEVITDTLRQSIIEGEFKPGDRLIQDEIADRYGVSRIPVREAMRTLSAEGLLTFSSRRGAIVTALSAADIEEILSIRAVLEGMATRLTTERATEKELDKIRQVFHRLEAARGDVELYFQYNFEFHEAILEAAHSPPLKELVTNLRNAVEPVARRYLIAAGRVEIAHHDHLEILEALERRNPQAAGHVAAGHTQHVLAGILDDYRQPKSSFKRSGERDNS